MRRPVVLLTLLAAALTITLQWPSLPDIATGLLGAVTGALIGLLSLQLGMLAGALALGVRVHQVVIGVGTRLADWSTVHRAFVLRAVPLFLSVSIGPGRAPVRRRMWGAAASSAGIGILASAATVTTALTSPTGFRQGLAIGCCLAVGHALVPRKTAGSTSTGWLLFRLPGLTGVRAQQLEAAPVVGRTVDATQAGDLDTAQTLAAQLAADHPHLRTATAARVLVSQARGRYAEAMGLAVTLASDREQAPHEAAVSFAALAGLACATVEAGQLDAGLGLSTAGQAIENAEILGYPTYKLNGSRALRALLSGDAGLAVRLARMSAESGDDRIGRADDYATLGSAHMASGDNTAARAALAEAEKLVPWWPRVAALRARLDVS